MHYTIGGYDLRVDLVPLKIYYFDVILLINWLSMYYVRMNCYTKIVTLRVTSGDKGNSGARGILCPVD